MTKYYKYIQQFQGSGNEDSEEFLNDQENNNSDTDEEPIVVPLDKVIRNKFDMVL